MNFGVTTLYGRSVEGGRTDAQHGNSGLTFWHEDDGTVVLHGRFAHEIGARILAMLDAVKAAHEDERQAVEWNNEDPTLGDDLRGKSRQGASPSGNATGTGARAPPVADRRGSDIRVSPCDLQRRTFLRRQSRTMRWRFRRTGTNSS